MNVRGIRTLRLLAAGGALASLALAGAASLGSQARQDVSTVPSHLAAYAASLTPAGASRTIWAYVVNAKFGTVTPINTATNKAAKTIKVGSDPVAIAITPNGKTAIVVNYGSGTVTPINTATNKAGKAVKVGKDPIAIAITPNGKTAYVVNEGSGTVTPVPIAGGRTGPAIAVGSDPTQMAITPNGVTGYVVSSRSDTVTPIHLPSDTALPPISFAYSSVNAISIAPNGKIAYATISAEGVMAEIQTSTNTVSGYIGSGPDPVNIVIAPAGSTAYVVNTRWAVAHNQGGVTAIRIPAGTSGQPIVLNGQSPREIAIAPDGKAVYVLVGNTATPIPTATGKAGKAIHVGNDPIALAITPNSGTVYVVNHNSDTVTPISTTTNKARSPIIVGVAPVTIAIMP
jgi:YVTN family beta-propeller protein